MKPSPQDHEKLERLIHATLRDLPPRRAPFSLEGRVQAALAARAALPWYRQSYRHWPAAVRTGFFVFSALVAALIVAGLYLLMGGSVAETAASEVTARFEWLSVFRTLSDAGESLYRAIPPLWLYGGLALVGACYATLIGVGAAAYRAFVHQR